MKKLTVVVILILSLACVLSFSACKKPADPTAPSAPLSFTATAGNAQAELSWSAPSSDGGSPITKYEVSKDGGTTWATASSNTTHTFTALTNGTEHTFQVRAINKVGNGGAATVKATPMSVSPDTPSGFKAVAGLTHVTLSWGAPSTDGGSPITKYEVSKTGGIMWLTASSNTTHTFTDLPNGTQYIFNVRAVNAVGNSTAASVTITTLAPTAGLKYTLTGDNTYTASIGTATSTQIVIAPTYKGLPVTGIADYGFKDSAATSVFIPDGIISIGYDAFGNCVNLSSVTIPDGITHIGGGAFLGCTSLTNITIPDSVTYMGVHAFNNTGIYNNAADNSVLYVGDWVVAYKGTSAGNIELRSTTAGIADSSFYECGITGITIPYGVTYIGDYTFGHNAALSSITIPETVVSIGHAAFYNCISLTSITIPNSMISIGTGVFSYCTGLTDITIPDGVVSIGNSAFTNCTNLANITIPDSVVSIGNYCFNNCTSLTSITIPDSVTFLGNCVFYNCTALTSATIPDSVISVGYDAFYGTAIYNNAAGYMVYVGDWIVDCKDASITTASLRSGTAGIAGRVFERCENLASITIPDGVKSIGDSAFSSCSSLKSLTIPDGVIIIGDSAFNGCFSLRSLTIPGSVKSIGDSAFSFCDLESITISDGVISIGGWAFSNCTMLASITIPASVEYIGNAAFYSCSYLTAINVDSSNINYCSVDGVLFNKNKTVLICCPSKKSGDYIIPDGVTSIAAYAFNRSKLTTITIPDGVTSIGEQAFYRCLQLTSIAIPGSVTSIGYAAFRYCEGLTSVTIENGLTEIGAFAFASCYVLTTITIPNSVTNIGIYAFDYCNKLTIYCEAASQPSGWDEDWNDTNCPVVWDCLSAQA